LEDKDVSIEFMNFAKEQVFCIGNNWNHTSMVLPTTISNNYVIPNYEIRYEKISGLPIAVQLR
jgi:hypothetical protein